jgi:hypothetical protein
MNHEHDAALGAGHAEMPAGAVVRDEGVVDCAGRGDGEELSEAGARGGEVMLDPGVGGFGVGEVGPDVEGIGDGVGRGRLGSFGGVQLGIFFNYLHG